MLSCSSSNIFEVHHRRPGNAARAVGNASRSRDPRRGSVRNIAPDNSIFYFLAPPFRLPADDDPRVSLHSSHYKSERCYRGGQPICNYFVYNTSAQKRRIIKKCLEGRWDYRYVRSQNLVGEDVADVLRDNLNAMGERFLRVVDLFSSHVSCNARRSMRKLWRFVFH